MMLTTRSQAVSARTAGRVAPIGRAVCVGGRRISSHKYAHASRYRPSRRLIPARAAADAGGDPSQLLEAGKQLGSQLLKQAQLAAAGPLFIAGAEGKIAQRLIKELAAIGIKVVAGATAAAAAWQCWLRSASLEAAMFAVTGCSRAAC